MSVTVRGRSDKYVKQFVGVLERYTSNRPNARAELYKTDLGTVRVRIIDPDFKGLSIEEREDPVWELLNQLPDDTLGFLGTLLLITPQETKKSMANMDFENPIPSPTYPHRRNEAR